MSGLFPVAGGDIVLLVLYGLFLVYITARIFGPHRRDVGEYLVASRAVTLPGFVATLVSTWYGGILGVGEYTYRYGVSNWLVFGVPYYLWAAVFAIFLAKRAHASAVYTLPDQLYAAYGKPTGAAGAALVFLYAAPAGYVLMLGSLLSIAFGWPLWVGAVGGTILSTMYLFRGGLRSIVITERIQFVLMFGGFAVILPYLLARYGGLGFLRANLPASHWTWNGGAAPQAVFVWYVLAMITLVEPAFYQRCYAAKSPAVARNGILVSIVFWMLFDFMTTTVGLYARAALPHLADPVAAYPALAAQVLPSIALGMFMLGMLATVMSTVDSYAFVAAVTLGRDLWWRLAGGDEERVVPRATRIGLFFTAALSIGVALAYRSVIDVWKDFGSVITPALLVPTLTALFPRVRMRPRFALASLLGAAATGAGWLAATKLGGHLFLGVEAIYPALGVGLAIFALDRVTRGARGAGVAGGIGLLALAIGCAAAPQSGRDELVGRWRGSATFQGARLDLCVRFARDSTGLRASLSSPDLLLLEQPLEGVEHAGLRVRFVTPEAPPLRFDGILEGDSIRGTATAPAVPGVVDAGRAGGAIRFALGRVAGPEPLPYTTEEITFTSGALRLAGTVYTPAGGEMPRPGVVILQGSSTNLRREYRFFADRFNRHGFTVLTFDKRGCGESTGDYGTATYNDLAADAAAAVEFLRARPGVDSASVGIWGLSQGAFLAPFVAARVPALRFIVAVSAPGMPIATSAAYQDSVRLVTAGFDAADVARAVTLNRELSSWLATGDGGDALAARLALAAEAPWRRASSLPETLPSVAALEGWYWRGRLLDPAPAWRAVKVPVLAIYGAADELVPAGRSAAMIEAALRAGGNRDATVRIFPAANHMLRTLPLVAGGAWDWPRAAPGYLELTTRWMKERVR